MAEEQQPPRTRRSAWVSALPNLAVILAVATSVAWAGGQGGVTAANVPVIWWCALLAFAIQWLAFVPAYLRQTEHYFDLTGSLTYFSVAIAALVVTGAFDPRSLLIVGLVCVWAGRLGSFLFRRVKRDGRDGRFDRIKTSVPRFLVAWTLQGLWVFLTFAAGLAAITAGADVPLGVLDFVGLAVWLIGFVIEVTADGQKRAFRADPANQGRFIQGGLWSWSRHPNYFGEIVLWTGIALLAVSTLEGWRWATLISPIFVTMLLTRISGIPLLEARAKKRWGSDPEYQAYCKRTPVLVPWPPGS